MDKGIIDDGLAFPMHNKSLSIDQKYWGMTLRDYFAAQVLPALAEETIPGITENQALTRTNAAYRWADQMLKSRDPSVEAK